MNRRPGIHRTYKDAVPWLAKMFLAGTLAWGVVAGAVGTVVYLWP